MRLRSIGLLIFHFHVPIYQRACCSIYDFKARVVGTKRETLATVVAPRRSSVLPASGEDTMRNKVS